MCLFRKVKTERAILVLLFRDDDPFDQITPIAKLGPATVYTCIRVIESVNESIAILLTNCVPASTREIVERSTILT